MAESSAYYDETAEGYDALHSVESNPEHTRALEFGWPLFGPISSVLDVGCGTGRSLLWVRDNCPGAKLLGVEPSAAMINIARQKVPVAEFYQGHGEALPCGDRSVDVAIATGIMHHADHPDQIISEMFRVSRRGVLISDHNNYAFGGERARRLRVALKICGLLKAATYVRQGFNRRGYSESDGWWYPYSLLDNWTDIASRSEVAYLIPTRDPVGSGNLLFTQGHFAVVGIKESTRR